MKHAIMLAVLVFMGGQALAQTLSDEERQLAAENLREADANGDQMLTPDEFRQFIDLNAADNLGRAARIRNTGLYNRAFQRLDASGDGLLTPEELRDIAGDGSE
ncbi:MAG: hypothetical protein AAFU41_19390 [Pseudomonadota bacterium]